jgi:hypothetical protein
MLVTGGVHEERKDISDDESSFLMVVVVVDCDCEVQKKQARQTFEKVCALFQDLFFLQNNFLVAVSVSIGVINTIGQINCVHRCIPHS